ncbi:MAG: hypothetical protein AAF990_21380 [Bacteroidota bacterium]
MRYLFCLCTLSLLFSCTHKSTNDEVAKYKAQFQQDEFELEGTYHWDFQLMGGTQHSIHTLYADSITYSMKGKVYSTEYTMQKLSFDKTNNKWIGRDENGIIYVLFFKGKTDQSLTIYKHKCKKNGLQEALAFDVPKPDATEDHGWNIYSLDKPDERDVLAVQGIFKSDAHTLTLADGQVSLDEQSFSKLSYHAGERRWVGQQDSTYLQVFFKDFDDGEKLYVSASKHEDLEKAYRIKFHEVAFLKYEKQ